MEIGKVRACRKESKKTTTDLYILNENENENENENVNKIPFSISSIP